MLNRGLSYQHLRPICPSALLALNYIVWSCPGYVDTWNLDTTPRDAKPISDPVATVEIQLALSPIAARAYDPVVWFPNM